MDHVSLLDNYKLGLRNKHIGKLTDTYNTKKAEFLGPKGLLLGRQISILRVRH